jgi:hypothetical protein
MPFPALDFIRIRPFVPCGGTGRRASAADGFTVSAGLKSSRTPSPQRKKT